MSLPVEPVVEPDAPVLVPGLAAGAVPLLVSVGLLTSVPLVVGELPALVCANADVASIVPAAVSASTVIHVFIALLVFIKVLLVLLSWCRRPLQLAWRRFAIDLHNRAPQVAFRDSGASAALPGGVSCLTWLCSTRRATALGADDYANVHAAFVPTPLSRTKWTITETTATTKRR
jgi:hypothetical protein